LGWLAALVATSFLLLILQLAAGFSTGALTLIADSAHTAADTVSYGFNWLVERAKRSAAISQSDKASRASVRFDAWSAVFSVGILLCTSACASADAFHRLFGNDAKSDAENKGKEDLGLIGHALLGFAIVSTVVNVLLLVLHRCRLGASSVKDVPLAPPPSLSDAMVPPPPPPPLAIPRQGGRDRAAKRSKVALLHQAFHPSCDLANCPIGSEAEVAASPDSSTDGIERSGASTREETNLNLYGAVLHLFTDVLRSVVILAVGLLVELGVIRDAGYADAICAIVVSICIVVGSLALLRAAAKSLCGKMGDVARSSSANTAFRLSPV
jgi:Co/Zn/Cd efflux system component